ncbi:MAG: GNAT family N-acetyltransferase [Candidatus Sulfotelmatobacter sp.]
MPLELYAGKDLSQPLLGEITEFLDSQETSHLFQFPQWNAGGARVALLREGGAIRWFGTFGTHSPLGSSVPWMRAVVANRGPVCDDNRLWQTATEEFIAHMRVEGMTYCEVFPDWVQTPDSIAENHLRDSGWQGLGEERSSLRLELTKSDDEIFANFRKNSRYEIRRAERLGVSVVPASADVHIEEFLMLHARVAVRKGFLAEAPDDLRGPIRWLIGADSRGALLLARAENQVYGGAVIGRAGKRCWYVWGAADKHEQFNVGHILQWKALLWAKSHGCREYDFGGYTPGATSGPAWFKAGFGGTVVRFVRPHRKVIRRGYYRTFDWISRMRELSRRRWVLPTFVRNEFPAPTSTNPAEK